MCLVLGQATSFVALYLHTSLNASSGAKSSQELWALLCATEAGFIIFYTVFLATIRKEYRGTFFSTLTAKQAKARVFRGATNDEMKMDIFWNHPSYYAGFRDEVEKFVRENYDTWNETSPKWFTERVKASIPKYMIPENETPVVE